VNFSPPPWQIASIHTKTTFVIPAEAGIQWSNDRYGKISDTAWIPVPGRVEDRLLATYYAEGAF